MREVKMELARRDLYEYCRLMIPQMYNDRHPHLKKMANTLQWFIEESPKHFLVLNAPPRFGKSMSGQQLVQWRFGNDPSTKVMTGSYNEKLAEQFAKGVRNAIQTPVNESDRIQFGNIFPGVEVDKNDAAAGKWRLKGSPVPSYLATSPTGTAGGIGANLILIDDIIKNAEEAYSDVVKQGHVDWFYNTMMQRTEGGDWKVIIIMTRWATDDLAGIVMANNDCEVYDLKAWNDDADGKRIWTCPAILNEDNAEEKLKNMNKDIRDANFQQDPIDIKGRLYPDGFNTYNPKEIVPQGMVMSVTDTADKGSDSLCSIIYFMQDDIAYVLDVVFTDSQMEVTEQLCARKLDEWKVSLAFVESNNGGRLWARNVRRNMKNKACIFEEVFQTTKKETRILMSKDWNAKYVWFPDDWRERWPEFAEELLTYNAKGRNEHDDAPDAMAYLYEMCTNQMQVDQFPYEGNIVTEHSMYTKYTDYEPEFWGGDNDAKYYY